MTNHLRSRAVEDLIAIGLVRQALKSNIQAIKEIADRTEGKVPQARVEEPGDRNIKVNVEYIGGKEAFDRVRTRPMQRAKITKRTSYLTAIKTLAFFDH